MAVDLHSQPGMRKSPSMSALLARTGAPLSRKSSSQALHTASQGAARRSPPTIQHSPRVQHVWKASSPVRSPLASPSASSLLGMEQVVAPRSHPASGSHSPYSTSPPSGLSLVMPRTPTAASPVALMSPGTPAGRPRAASSPRRPKDTPLAVAWDHMATVPESVADSSTISTRANARHESAGLRNGKVATSIPAPIELEGSGVVDRKDSPRRASSVLLPSPMAPLIVPSEDLFILSPTIYRSTPEEYDVPPPKVPPKSPRTLHRAFYAPTPMSRGTSISSSATQSVSHTANSSITSVESADGRLPRSWTAVKPNTHSRPASRSSTAPVRPDHHSVLPWTMKEFKPTGLKTHREPASMDEKTFSVASSTSTIASVVTIRPPVSSSSHQRGESDSSSISQESIMNRGRPMRRGEVTSVQRGPTRASHHLAGTSASTFPTALASFITSPPPVPEEPATLPTALARSGAPAALGSTDLHSLRKDAHFQAATYEALTPTALAALYQELAALTPRADRLHHTLTSLRTARTTLHDHIATYLANANGPMSREHLARQQHALRELNVRIDEWIGRIEEVDARRNLLQRKALEHAAAVLVAEVPRDEHGMTTPPRSPERKGERRDDRSAEPGAEQQAAHAGTGTGTGSPRRQEVESIRVYADSGVASLLASIEMEIGMLNPERRGLF